MGAGGGRGGRNGAGRRRPWGDGACWAGPGRGVHRAPDGPQDAHAYAQIHALEHLGAGHRPDVVGHQGNKLAGGVDHGAAAAARPARAAGRNQVALDFGDVAHAQQRGAGQKQAVANADDGLANGGSGARAGAAAAVLEKPAARNADAVAVESVAPEKAHVVAAVPGQHEDVHIHLRVLDDDAAARRHRSDLDRFGHVVAGGAAGDDMLVGHDDAPVDNNTAPPRVDPVPAAHPQAKHLVANGQRPGQLHLPVAVGGQRGLGGLPEAGQLSQ